MGAVVAWRFWGFCVLHATSGFKAACPSAGVLLQMLKSPRRRSCRVDGPDEGPWHAVPAAPPSPKLGSSHDYSVSYKQPYYVKHFPLLPPEKACRAHEHRGGAGDYKWGRSMSVCPTELKKMTGQAAERERSPHNLSVRTTLEEEIERAESILSRWRPFILMQSHVLDFVCHLKRPKNFFFKEKQQQKKLFFCVRLRVPSVCDDTSSELQRVAALDPHGRNSRNSFQRNGAISRYNHHKHASRRVCPLHSAFKNWDWESDLSHLIHMREHKSHAKVVVF